MGYGICYLSNIFRNFDRETGSIHGFFKGGKCLRQGDPLSLFLFMLCLEYFSRMVKVATNDSEFNYHPKCDPLKMTHLTFTDDLILFARGDVMSVQILMDCLSNFDFASGLRMNILKPSLYTVGVYGKELDDIIELTNFLKGTMSFRYLATIISRIITLCQKFLWGSKKPLVAWKDVCLQKNEGVSG
ncbi:Hypothetical predicted protein [Olea europaea subsp. europaea]|uniref:Reverse transcriptase domain-containing protein n=1 Tax=Olea europaea subsp. europaea TaxID=158383 RepID=A0A8S0T5M0_OLEEU|nr:Hypothetical predicted protein [Olea europaea subsp. europaea]